MIISVYPSKSKKHFIFMKTISTFLLVFICCFYSFGQTLLKDIATANRNSGIQNGISNNNGTYFFADPNLIESKVSELWKTDGTPSGTYMVKNYLPTPKLLSTSTNLTFFITGEIGYQSLWRSDGTANGTVIIKSNIYNVVQTFSGGGYLFYYACTSSGIMELWRSDGTASGTIFLMTISSPSCTYIQNTSCMINGTLYFSLSSGPSNQLWKSDGNSVTNINNLFSSLPKNLTALNNNLFFTVDNILWKSDGTGIPAGTVQITFTTSNIVKMSSTNNLLFLFNANGDLYKSDGNVGNLTFVQYSPMDVQTDFRGNVGNTIFFTRNQALELWKTDGVTTSKVKDLQNVSFTSAGYELYHKYFSTSSLLYFWEEDGNGGRELWRTDGTTAGTQMLKDVYSSLNFKNAFPIAALNANKLIFTAFDSIHGVEPWVTDGTSLGTFFLKDINTNLEHQHQESFMTGLNGKVYFVANDVEHGNELWETDGTTAGTNLLKDFSKFRKMEYKPENQSDYSHTKFGGMIAYKGKLIFSITDIGTDTKLYKYENNVFTPLIIFSNSTSSKMKQNFIVFKDEVYFTTSFGIGKTNGEFTGTIIFGNYLSFAEKFVILGDYLYFIAYGNNGTGIYRTDGNTITTVKEFFGTEYINTDDSYSYYYQDDFIGDNNYIYFTTNRQQKLWRTDGTEAGTILLKNFQYQEMVNITEKRATFLNNKIYFKGFDSINNDEPWESDGTVGGTKIFANINSNGPSFPNSFITIGNEMYFTARDANNQVSLLKSDGNSSNISTVNFPTGGINNPFNANGRLIFNTNDVDFFLFSMKPTDTNPVVLYQNLSVNHISLDNVSKQKSKDIYHHYNGKLYFRFDNQIYGSDFNVMTLCGINQNISKNEAITQNSVTYNVSERITAQNKISGTANVNYGAGKSITLNSGFEIKSGAVFKAEIGGCSN
jgi:trimeric autotransporter adhesin